MLVLTHKHTFQRAVRRENLQFWIALCIIVSAPEECAVRCGALATCGLENFGVGKHYILRLCVCVRVYICAC